MPGQGVGQSTTQVDEMDVVLKSSEPVHFASPTYSKCRAISHRLVDRVEAFWLKSHPLGHPTCLVQNSHFQSQTNMVLSQFCKGPKSCCIQLIIWYLIHHHGIPAKGFFSLYLSRHIPRTSLPLLDPISLTSSLILTPSTQPSDVFTAACSLHVHFCLRAFALAFSSAWNALLLYTHRTCFFTFFMYLPKCYLFMKLSLTILFNSFHFTSIPNTLSFLIA